MQTVLEMPVEEALALLHTRDKNIVVAGHRVKTGSQRYELFRSKLPRKGLQCVSCDRVGVIMRLEKPDHASEQHPADRAHFNLYSADGELLTKDHILPKSKGGRNSFSNYQTMCAQCNHAKGNVEEGQVRLGTFGEADVAMKDHGEQARPERCGNFYYEWDGMHYIRYDNGVLFKRYSDIPRKHQEQGWVILP